MSAIQTLSRQLSRPNALWVLFAIVISLSAVGLAVLSQHAMKLNRDQRTSEARENLQQNLSVALWRLDSRLGPYIATLHDFDKSIFPQNQPAEFILQRFAIRQDNTKSAGGFRIVSSNEASEWGTKSSMMQSGNSSDDCPNWNRLVTTIPVHSIVDAVEELIPNPVMINQIINDNQNYGVQVSQNSMRQAAIPDPPRSQQSLANRIDAVQQQLNISRDSTPTVESQTTPNTKWMSVWINEQLVVMRSSQSDLRELEGVWVDWPRLRESLAEDIKDILPDASVRAVTTIDEIDPARTLAAIPAMIDSNQVISIHPNWSPTHTALSLAWFALCCSALIASIALSRLIALSERRAAFVSAVTHELRTPLTTFRLYSDLLARDMVSDPGDRKEYFQTLQREADRLTHLVDNVLRYSKLQRTSKAAALETIVLGQWIDRIEPRLKARLADADMTLVIEKSVGDAMDSQSDLWATDPPAMEQVLFNLIDNAAKYASNASDRRVHLAATIKDQFVTLQVSDHGDGVPNALRTTIFKPFTKSAEQAAETAAGVGLGLALAKQTVVALGGNLTYQHGKDGGASFLLRIPQGNVEG